MMVIISKKQKSAVIIYMIISSYKLQTEKEKYASY